MGCSRARICLWHCPRGRHGPVDRPEHAAGESIECSSSIFSSGDSARRSAKRSDRARRRCRIPARNQVSYAEEH